MIGLTVSFFGDYSGVGGARGSRLASLPCSINAERAEVVGFGFGKLMLDQAIHAGAARSAPQAGPQLGQILRRARSQHFDLAFFGITHPAAQVPLAGLPLHIPAEAHPLHATLNEKMNNPRS